MDIFRIHSHSTLTVSYS